MITYTEKLPFINDRTYEADLWNALRGRNTCKTGILDKGVDTHTGAYNLTPKSMAKFNSYLEQESLFRSIATGIRAYDNQYNIKTANKIPNTITRLTPLAAQYRDQWYQATKGENLALGKEVNFSIAPEFYLTATGGKKLPNRDRFDLTDGALSVRGNDVLRFDYHAVGWRSKSSSGADIFNGVDMIEIVERTDKVFAVGLQFHPEAAIDKNLDCQTNAADYMSYDDAIEVFTYLVDLVD